MTTRMERMIAIWEEYRDHEREARKYPPTSPEAHKHKKAAKQALKEYRALENA